jgi:hypothetical protein
MGLGKDIWRIGLVAAPADQIAAHGLEDSAIRWVAGERPFSFLADPFGLWRDGALHVFAEAYDYRTRHGVIEHLLFDVGLELQSRRTVLQEPWHLSYPFVLEAEGETWMLPEAHRSGALTLYRAAEFPSRWEPVLRLELDTAAIDPTLFRHDGLWWLAYSPNGTQAEKQGQLHLAFAERLIGPWTPHTGNPVRRDRASSRPGGPALRVDDALRLPVQDCSRTYGGAIRLLRVDELTPDSFRAEAGPLLGPPASAGAFQDGLHTFAACGPVTLIDVKRIDRSPRGLAIDVARRFGRWAR